MRTTSPSSAPPHDRRGPIAARSARADQTPLRIVFTGPEGVGKTTLATLACHAVGDHYPDAQLFYELHGTDSDVEVRTEDIAADFLRQFGWTGEEIPASPSERIKALRSQLAGKRVLMVLDDVARAEQVDQLLFESPTAIIVVTTRNPLLALQRKGFRRFEVEPFADEHARELIAVRTGDRASEIGSDVLSGVREVCEGLPLALEIAAVRLAQPDEEPEEFLAELRSERPYEAFEIDGDRPVLRLFDAAYQRLTSDEARAYTLLSELPGPHYCAGVAAAALGMDDGAVRRMLRELARRHVLEWRGGDRFRFSSLVRAHARDRARAEFPPAELAAARERARQWYWRRQVALDKTLSGRPVPIGAKTAYAKIEPAFTGPDAGRQSWAEVELEWPNLIAAMRDAGEQPADELVKVFPLSLWYFGYQTRRCVELIDGYQRALDHAATKGEAWQLHRDLAGLYEQHGEYDEADRSVRQALDTGFEAGFESVHSWHGLAREGRGDLHGALESFQRAVDAIPLMADEFGEFQQDRAGALLAMHRGRVLIALDESRLAEEPLRAARVFFTEHVAREAVNLALTTLYLGQALARTDRGGEAVPMLESAFGTFNERSMRKQAIKAAGELAWVAEERGDTEGVTRWRAIADEAGGAE